MMVGLVFVTWQKIPKGLACVTGQNLTASCGWTTALWHCGYVASDSEQ